MYSYKTSVKGSKTTVRLSDKHTFYLNGHLFRIFKSKGKTPNSPQLAILDITKGERLSGLFHQEGNRLKGDIKVGNGKELFWITVKDQNLLELENFQEALEMGGVFTPKEENEALTEPYRALKQQLEFEPLTEEADKINTVTEPTD